MFNTLDSDILDGAGFDLAPAGAISKFAMSNRINFKVTNAAGDVVSVPNNFITNVTSSNPTVVKVDKRNAGGSFGRWYMIGNKAGSATITATYIDNKGKTKFATQTVTVISDAPTVADMTASKKVTVTGGGTYAQRQTTLLSVALQQAQ